MQRKNASTDTPKKANARDDRLKAALKANLAKRKAQARQRQDTPAADTDRTPSSKD